MKYIYSTSQMSKLSLTLCTFSMTGLVTSLFLTIVFKHSKYLSDVDQEHIVMIRRVQRVVGTEQEEY